MGAWFLEKGLSLIWKAIVFIGALGAGWGMLRYQVSDAVKLGEENKAEIHSLWTAKAADQQTLSQTLQKIQHSLGRIEGALGTRDDSGD